MTPEQRLNRIERILGLFVREGRRLHEQSREQNEKINILIHTQMETSEQINRFSEKMNRFSEQIDRSSIIHDREMGDLRRSQGGTDQALRGLINALRKDRNGPS